MTLTSRLILILGMHRSGTSLIAHSTGCFGAALGPHADWFGEDNPRGFAEDQEVLSLNDNFLRAWNESWTSLKLPHLGAFPTETAAWMLEERLKAFPLFALKEPRMCRLLPQWRRALDQVRCEVSVIEVVRHPWDVAQSLLVRNRMPVEYGLALWHDHVHRTLTDRDPTWPCVTVAYEAMLADPIREISRIGAGLDMPVEHDGLREFLADRFDPNMHHHAGGDDAPPLPVDIAAMWAAAKERAEWPERSL